MGVNSQEIADFENVRISIVTVIYNASKTLEATILSVINQTYLNIDYIIIDGASTDGSIDIIKKYQKYLKYWVSEPDAGIYDAMNKGLKIAEGHWLLFLGADDVLFNKSVVSDMVSNFTSPNTIYYGNALFKLSNKLYNVNITKFFLCIKNISHQTVFYPKAVYKRYSYDLKYLLFSDHIYNIKLFTEGIYKFVHLPVVTAIYNDAGSSAEGTDPKYFLELPRIVGKSLGWQYGVYVFARFKIFKAKRYVLKHLKRKIN